MGIRFLCPNGHKLNVKADLAGKRASCPECGAKLVIPSTDAASVAPEAIVAKPAAPAGAVWYVRTAGGEQLGPATDSQFSDWIHAGKVNADALVWRDGWDQWKLARDAADELPVPLVAVAVPTPSPAAITAAALSPLRQPPARGPIAAPAPDLDPRPPKR